MRVLLVEDDLAVACFVESFLQDQGYEVTTTPSPDEAIALVESETSFDLLVTDFNLSSIQDGADVAHRFNDQESSRAVVMISGRPFEARRRLQGLSPGVILPKPFAGSELMAAIDRAFEQVS